MPCCLDEATHHFFLCLLPWNAREYSTSVRLLCVRVRKKQETIGSGERETQRKGKQLIFGKTSHILLRKEGRKGLTFMLSMLIVELFLASQFSPETKLYF